jgi:hypothetical protein
MPNPAYTIKQLEPDNYDTRLEERHLSDGRITAKSLSDHLGKLPDLASQGTEFTVALGEDPEEAE